MPTHAELSATLLRDAATFFRTLAEQNAPIRGQMVENAFVFEHMAELLLKNADAVSPDGTNTYAVLGGKLLKEAAGFFRTMGSKNEPIREQMDQNADIYEQLGEVLAQNPFGIID